MLSRAATKCSRLLQIYARPYSSVTLSGSSVNDAEIAHFSRLSAHWWDERGEFGFLHKMNPVRMQFIREKLLETALEERGENAAKENLFSSLDVLDVGCGGGLLSESLARSGARTTGIDASASNIVIASLHASADPKLASSNCLTYCHTSAEDVLAGSQRYDVVCSMEVLEHVDNPASFLSTCAELVKPGGHLFLSSIARTPLSYLLTIVAAEQILKKVTPGTHTYSKYINPSELISYFENYGSPVSSSPPSDTAETTAPRPWISRSYPLPTRTEAEVRGLIYLPWKAQWTLTPRSTGSWGTQSNYIFWVRKPFET